MSTKITFSEWVAEREAAGKSKGEVADEIGTTLTSLYRYLSNDRVPDRDTMKRILDRSDNRVDVACFYATAPDAEPAQERVA